MYIKHIDHRSGAPWGPHGREGGKFFSRQSRENFFPGKGAPWGGPKGGPGAWDPLGDPGPPTLARRGPWGPPRLVCLPEKNVRGFAANFFFRFTVEFWRFVLAFFLKFSKI